MSKLYETPNKWIKLTQLHLPSNITKSDTCSFYVIHDAL
jgi:hypothetical protein